MASTGWTQADIDALRASIAEGGGAVMITFSDRTVTFSSLQERMNLLAEMVRQVNREAEPPPTSRFAAFRKGTGPP